MASPTDRLRNLSPADRRRLVERLRRRRAPRSVPPPPAVCGPESSEEVRWLSYGQERLWFLDQLAPGSPMYNVPVARRLKGELDLAALTWALGRIVARHEVLRTVFAVEPAERRPIQVVRERVPVDLPLADLTTGAEGTSQVTSQVLAEVRRPFDLQQGPLWRALVLRLAPEDHLLLVTMHHTVSDGWSVGLFLSELAELYSARRQDRSPRVPELSLQYTDYALWQRRFVQEEVLTGQLAYWRRILEGCAPSLELPTDRPRPMVQTSAGARLEVRVSEDRTASLELLSRRLGTTLFMTLLSVFKILLFRYTAQSDLLVGTPVAGRRRVEHETLIGYFANTLILRTEVTAGLSFRELVGRVREAAVGAYNHQDLPFEKLVEELQPERNLSQSPFVQTFFALQNLPMQPLRFHGLEVEAWHLEPGTAKFDLLLELHQHRGSLVGAFEYNTDLFDRTTIARMAEHFSNLVSAVMDDVEVDISRLPMMSDAEGQTLERWNRTTRPLGPRISVSSLVEAQVKRTPGRTALVCDGEEWTFRELNRRANGLARELRRRGVGHEVPVGVLVERGPDVAVAVLAVLKAGGAYVPLDPAYPGARLDFMVRDSGCRLVLSHSTLPEGLVESAVERLFLDRERSWLEAATEEDLDVEVAPENLAYVIYTSGSTGRPKGVAMPHGSLVNLIRWQLRAAPDAARTLQLAPLSFDVSFQEMFSTWAGGGTLVLVSEARRKDPEALLEHVASQQIERLFAPPVALQQLAEAMADPTGGGSALREVITAGEQLRVSESMLSWFESCPGLTLHNHYGPTETHVATAQPLSGPPRRWPQLPPIGRPIDNLQIHLLDAQGQRVPIGVVGEIAIGAGGESGLARGYLGQPRLTAERFVPDAFGSQPGGRLYLTGDLGRYLASGEIEFLGRNDQQVKVRGYRIEPGEVEVVLGEHAAVSEVTVVARHHDLVAYVVGVSAQPPQIGALRSFLSRRLPQYMVPSAFVTLDRMPLTPSGKVDVKSLPAPHQQVSRQGGASAPSTPIAEILAGVWAEVLGYDDVGVDENFFELGGHSLLATQLISRVRDVFSQKVSLRSLFEAPTVRAMAEVVTDLLQRSAPARVPPLEPLPRPERIPLSYAQQRLWFLDQLVPDNPFYNFPIKIRLLGRLSTAALEFALNETVRRHEALRTVFPVGDGEPEQRVLAAPEIRLSTVDLSPLPAPQREAQAHRLANQEAAKPFALPTGPLLRAKLLRLGPEETILLLTLHHIVCDGWSVGVLCRELRQLYLAHRRGQPSPLPELAVQYPDYSLWQSKWLAGDLLEGQLDYWRHELDGLSVLQLSTDRPRPTVERFVGDFRDRPMPRDLHAAVKALSQRHGTTLFMTLLAGFVALLHRYTAQDDIVVGSAIAGRHWTALEELIGLFVNTQVLRTPVGGDPSFSELLGRIRDVCLEAQAHQDVPFERLVDELQPDRDLSHNPLFQVTFVLQNFPLETLDLDGVTLQLERIHSRTAKFDLAVFMEEREEGLLATVEYNTDLFDATTVERLLGHYEAVLTAVASHPEIPIGEVRLLSPAQWHQLLIEWNDTEAKIAPRDPVHRLVEAQARQRPAATALVCNDETLSYGELNARANRLARHLVTLGVGPEVGVGMFLDRSIEVVVTMLAILKAGGAYVPLEPSHPPQRLDLVIRDSGISLVLTQARHASQLPTDRLTALCLDQERGRIAAHDAEDLTREVDADNLAYVIYTSGSTGRPKGVEVHHRGLTNLVLWDRRFYGFTPRDRGTQVAPISFDAATWEIWPYLAAGSSVHIVTDELRASPQLWEWLADQGITVSFLPTPLAASMLSFERPSHLALRSLLVGGELLHQPASPTWPFAMFNNYGPTEISAVATAGRVPVGGSNERVPPIGRPIDNVQIYLLDRRMEPVAWGLPGEMYIGGVGVSRGYRRRPALTAERFVPNPFSCVGGERLYRTGDLARFQLSGEIEFLRRIDDQVKARGFRIELGEIESVLAEHERVRACLVLMREDLPGDKRLVAYVVQGQEHRTTGWEGDRVGEWRTLYDEVYTRPPAGGDPRFNIVGWNSSATGEALPIEQMREWVDGTVERVLARGPRRVLEIGCGTGLLLFRLAPSCERYVGTDFSPPALHYIRRYLHSAELDRVVLEERLADDFSGLERHSFDTVVLNSIVQYFPSVEYLLRVLEGAVEVVADGGCLFVGDVRNHVLLGEFHAWTQLDQAPSSLSAVEFQQRVRQRMAQEQELLLSPGFFLALERHIPRVAKVEILLKEGSHHNELTAFRYDVVLTVGQPSPGTRGKLPWLDWNEEGLTLELLRRHLDEKSPELVAVDGVPNARVSEMVGLVARLGNGEDLALGEALAMARQDASGVDPAQLLSLGTRSGYSVSLSWSMGRNDGACAVLFRRPSSPLPEEDFPRYPRTLGARPWSTYANNPLQGRFAAHLVPELRRFLEERLPDYMVPSAFVLLTELPLTPNGKVDRRALPVPDRELLAAVNEFVAPRSDVEQQLAKIWSEVLGIEGVGVEDNFFELGGDSILSIQVVARAHEANLQLTARDLFEHQTVAALAGAAVAMGSAPKTPQGPVTGPVPLTPIQQWLFEQGLSRPQHFNQAVLLEPREPLDPDLLEEAWTKLQAHHDALRSRFEPRGDGPWRQEVLPPGRSRPLLRRDLSAVAAGQQREALEAECARLQTSLDLEEGDLCRLALFELGPRGAQRLLIVIHHLVVDGVSWRILLQDLETAYRQRLVGEAVRLPEKTTSFQDWALRLRDAAASPQLQREMEYWTGLQPTEALPVDFPGGENTVASTRTVTLGLDSQETQSLLQEVPRTFNTQINDVLLCALLQSFQSQMGRHSLRIHLEGHGREESLVRDVDLSRTVGWFTSLFPLHLTLPPGGNVETALQSVKAQLRRLPRRGVGYGVLRYMSGDPELSERLLRIDGADVNFNYLGSFDPVLSEEALWRPAAESSGPLSADEGLRPHLFEVNSRVVGGCFQATWSYSANLHRKATVEALAQQFNASLRHFCQGESPGAELTPADFPLAKISSKNLAKVLSRFAGEERG